MTIKTSSGAIVTTSHDKTAQESNLCARHGDGWVIATSIPEMAQRTGLSEGLLYAKANQGSLPGCRRIGKRFVIHIATFEEWLKTGMGEDVGE